MSIEKKKPTVKQVYWTAFFSIVFSATMAFGIIATVNKHPMATAGYVYAFNFVSLVMLVCWIFRRELFKKKEQKQNMEVEAG